MVRHVGTHFLFWSKGGKRGEQLTPGSLRRLTRQNVEGMSVNWFKKP